MKGRGNPGGSASTAVFCVFCAALLLSLAAGVSVYARVHLRAEEAEARRVGMSFLEAKLHAADADGAIGIGSFGDGDALFLTDSEGGGAWQTVLYVYDGWLMELYRAADADAGPEAGERIAEAADFSAALDGDLLTLTYIDPQGDADSAYLCIRSGGGNG